jgi:hypothetical protein
MHALSRPAVTDFAGIIRSVRKDAAQPHSSRRHSVDARAVVHRTHAIGGRRFSLHEVIPRPIGSTPCGHAAHVPQLGRLL